MAFYQPYLSIMVAHSYFASGIAQPVTVTPTEATLKWLDQHQMCLKAAPGGLNIFADRGTLADVPPPRAAVPLQFKLFSSDPYFRHYTDMPLSLSLAAAQFEAVIADQEPLFLTPQQWLSPEQMQQPEALVRVSQQDLSQHLTGLVSLQIPPAQFAEPGKEVTLTFTHCEAYWKYYFLSLQSSAKPEVFDQKQIFLFEAPAPTQLNHRPVMTCLSQTPVPVLQHSPFTFQLKSQHQTIYRRLPAADPHQLEIIHQGETAQRLCHLYVS
ncbi:hypothetical protein VA7868_01498 [Vibrio aerogenes CECT 7868]|uniref:Uncharacterized protein n=1 Tax=Vibrio aerogenes CECT 7868 TaxID=1216006 RepID=A0A1M5Y4S0_9VIBR|nr:hypothetical protein [Vibrio aerogenes]SHI07095.1 hypothetical protein VA7868_01498 [Vibrio aerogenes CECT 7868]